MVTWVSLPKTFFQQDEWQYFGNYVWALSSRDVILNIILPLGGQLTHFAPLANLFLLLQYLAFKVNFTGYAVVSLLLHLINTFLVYRLFKKIVKVDLVAFSATLIFFVYSLSHQAVSWVLTASFALPAVTFFVLSLIAFVNF